MSDWTKQAEEVVKTWTKAQQELWETWRSSVQQVGATQQATESWDKAVDFWKESVQKSLNVQIEWANLWANSVKGQANVPKELSQWTDQVVSTLKTWTESQGQLWENIIDSTKQAAPEAVVHRLDEGAKVAFDTWQNAVQKAIEAQKELSKYWTGSKTDK